MDGMKVLRIPWIVRAVLVPTFDCIRDLPSLPQSHAVEELCDLPAGGGIRQSLVGDCADDVVAVLTVGTDVPNRDRQDRDGNECSRAMGELHAVIEKGRESAKVAQKMGE